MKAAQRLIGLAVAGLLLATGGCTRGAKLARHLDRADKYYQAKEYEKAEIEYLNALRLSRTNATAIVRLGDIFYSRRAYAQAAPFLLRTVELQPDNLAAREHLAQLYLAARVIDKAHAEALNILQRSPSNELALLIYSGTAQTPEELQETEKRLAEFRQKAGDKPGFHLARANIQRQRKDLVGAEASIREALALDPQSERAHVALANLFWTQNKLEEANAEFEAAGKSAPPDSPTWMRIALFKVQTGRLDEGKLLLERITKDNPQETAAWNLRAEIALGEKKYDDCASLVAKALQKDERNYDALNLRARLKMARGKFPEAVSELEKLTSLYPRSADAQYNLGLAQLLNKDPDAASASLDKAILLDPNQVNAVLLKAQLQLAKRDPASAIAALTDAIQKFPRFQQAYFLLAQAYRAADRPKEALAVYQTVLKNSPDNARAAYESGLLLQSQRQTAEARKAYELALTLQTNSPAPLYRLVELDMMDRRYTNALKRVQTLVATETNSAAARLLEARVYGSQGLTNQAEAALRKAIELDPNANDAYLLLASMLLGSGRQAQALEELDTSLKQNTNNVAALILAGMMYSNAGVPDRAREAYEKALQINPRTPLALNNLAYLLVDKFNDPEKALQYATQARQIVPDDPGIADTLGWAQYQRGQYAEALSLLRESAAKLDTVAEVQYHVGMAAYMMGKEAEARIALAFASRATNDFSGKAFIAPYLAVLNADPSHADTNVISVLEERCRVAKNDVIAWTRLAAVYETQGAYDKARNAYENALQINPGAYEITARLALLYGERLNNLDKALELAKEARKLAPSDASVVHALGRLVYRSGDQAWAYNLLQEAARGLPAKPEVQYDLAWAAYSLGKTAEADQAMQAVVASTNSPANLVRAGKWFLDMEALARRPESLPPAEPQIQTLLKSVPDHAPALMALALLRQQQGRLDEARPIYEGILARYPKFTPAMKQLAILYADQGGNDAKGYEFAVKAREAFAGDEQVAKALGKLAYRKGDYRYAAQLLRESAQKRPDDADLFFHLGMACQQLKQTEEALNALEQALRLGPNAPFAAEATRVLAEIKKG